MLSNSKEFERFHYIFWIRISPRDSETKPSRIEFYFIQLRVVLIRYGSLGVSNLDDLN